MSFGDPNYFFNTRNSNVIRLVNDNSKLEVSLDTTGYKMEELKVTAGQGMICVEGKHEEKSVGGQVMLSRQFSWKHIMPSNVKVDGVVTKLSKNGVLVIFVPKRKYAEEIRHVRITEV